MRFREITTMKSSFAVRLAYVLVCFTVVAHGGSKRATAADDFVPLFNGKDLTGWKTEGNWVVEEDGVLSLQPREGESGWKRYHHYLWTEKQYGDFVLELDFKLRGNSGVFFRVGDLAEPVKTGYEVQMLGKYSGSLIGIRGNFPDEGIYRPKEWNHLVLTVRGHVHIVVEVNGHKVNDVTADGAKTRRPVKGYIGLQDHGQPVSYRNIRIKELDGGKK